MQPITSITNYQFLLEQYSLPGVQTNNFLLADQVNELLFAKKLYYIIEGNNLVFLVDRRISYQVYFHLNDLNVPFSIQADKPLMMEMVYRGEIKRPSILLNYWEQQGFQTHLTRDNLALVYHQQLAVIALNGDITIKYATTEQEAAYATALFEKDLDTYTGDLKTYEEILAFVNNKQILCAYEGDKLCGALQFEWKHKVCWLGHIVVDERFRGKGIANRLVEQYITLNKQTDQSRYQLWVIQDNKPAVDLYKRFGFIYAGKSTVSMLKLK